MTQNNKSSEFRQDTELAQQLLAATKAGYSADALQAGVYAEIHGRGADALLAIAPNTDRPLDTKMAAYGHSVFDSLLGRQLFRSGPADQQFPEIVGYVEQLGLCGHSVEARGILTADSDGDTLRVSHDQIETIDGQMAGHLRTAFAVQHLKVMGMFGGEEYDVDLESAPLIKSKITFRESGQEPESSYPWSDTNIGPQVQLGVSDHIIVSTMTGVDWGINGKKYVPETHVAIDFLTTTGGSHSGLIDKLTAERRKVEKGQYSPEYIESDDYANMDASQTKALARGTTVWRPLGRMVQDVTIQTRFSIYDYRQSQGAELKVDTIVTTDTPDETEKNFAELEMLGSVVLAATISGFTDRKLDVTGSTIIAPPDAGSGQLTYYKTFTLGTISSPPTVPKVLESAHATPWNKY